MGALNPAVLGNVGILAGRESIMVRPRGVVAGPGGGRAVTSSHPAGSPRLLTPLNVSDHNARTNGLIADDTAPDPGTAAPARTSTGVARAEAHGARDDEYKLLHGTFADVYGQQLTTMDGVKTR